MAAIVLSQVATSLLAPSIYGTLAAGASIAQSGFLWSVSQGLAGFAGSVVGSAIDRALFGSGAQNAEGPRLSDLSVQSSADGAALPVVYGTFRLAGNVIWSTGLEEIRHKEDVGGGSGGGGGSVTTYSYRTDAAVAICEGPIAGIRRIWADTKLIYDVGSDSPIDSAIASSDCAKSIRVYLGTETQEPDPLIQADVGATAAPAYRGTAYLVFEDLQLANFGNRLPNFQFEVVGVSDYGYIKSGRIACDQFLGTHDGVLYHVTTATGTQHATIKTPPIYATVLAEDPASYLSGLIETDPAVKYVWDDSFIRCPSTNPAEEYVLRIDTQAGRTTNLIRTRSGFKIDHLDLMTSALSGSGIMTESHILGFAFSSGDLVMKRLDCEALVVYDSVSQNADSYLSDSIAATFTFDLPEIDAVSGTPDKAMCFRANGSIFVCVSFKISGNVAGSALYEVVDALEATPTLTHHYRQRASATNLAILPVGLDFILFPDKMLTGELTTSALTDFNSGETLFGTATAFPLFVDIDDRLVVVSDDDYAQAFVYGLLEQYAAPLDTVCEDLCDRAGVAAADYDMSALSGDVVRGYAVSRPMAMRGALEPLMAAYHFDLIEQDGQLVAVKRGGAIAATLSADDLGAAENPDGSTVGVTRNNLTELPSEISLTYPDQGTEYQPGMQYSRRLTVSHTNRVTLNLPLVMTSQEAARLAEILLRVSWWSGRESYALNSTFDHLRLSPSDRVNVPVYGSTVAARLTDITAGAPGVVQINAVPDIANLYTGTAVGADVVDLTQVLGIIGPAKMNLLDCVMLRDQDASPGLYVAMGGYSANWPGGTLYKSADGGATWGLALTVPETSEAVMGYATTVLGDDGCTVWDRTNTVTVALYAGATLSSATEAAVLNGANAALIGEHGRWELIQFQNATDNGDGTWTLDTLLRGRRGTDYAAASHALFDGFILLSNTTVQDLLLSTGEISAERDYKAVTSGKALEATLSESLTYTGERLECLSPVDLRASRDGSSNITLTWKRRDRIGAGWNDYADIPMSESSEAYEVDIYTNGTYGTVKRTITGLSSATATYSAANQTTDFGSTQSTVYVRVYQVSATTGRGHYRQGAV